MTAKEYLKRGLFLNKHIEAKIEQVAMLNAMAIKTTPTLSDMPSSGNHDNSKMENTILKIISLQDEINDEIDRLVDTKKEVMNVIENVEESEERLVLTLRYLNFLPWEQVAQRMGCSERNVHNLHGRALEHVVVPS